MSIIWLTGFCGNSSEYDAFWSNNLTIDTDLPDLSLCFQNTVLIGVSCAYLWISAVIYLIILSGKVTKTNQHGSILNTAKLLGAAVMAVNQFVLLCVHLADRSTGESVPTASLVGPSLWTLNHIVAGVIIYVEYRKGIHSSTVLFFFYAITLITGIIEVRSTVIQFQKGVLTSVLEYVIRLIYFIFVCLEFILIIPSDLRAKGSERAANERDSDQFGERTPLLQASHDKQESPHLDAERPKRALKPCPEEDASFLNRYVYFWVIRFIIDGYKKPLKFEDMPDILDRDKTRNVLAPFLAKWKKAIFNVKGPNRNWSTNSKKSPSLCTTMLSSLWSTYLWGCVARFFSVLVLYANPFLLSALLDYLESGDPYLWKGVAICCLLFLTTTTYSLLVNSFRYFTWMTGFHTRSAFTAAIYRKALRLSSGSKRRTTAGQINNLIATDCQRFQDIPLYLCIVWTVPMMVIISTILLWNYMGVASIGGMFLLVGILVPFNGVFLANKIRKLQSEQMKKKDFRLKVSNEILSGIGVLKLYGWEQSFREKLMSIREEELRYKLRTTLINAFSSTIWNNTSQLISYVIYAVYIYMAAENTLTPQKAFVTASVVNVLSWPLSILPSAVSHMGQTFVAMQRIRKFLLLDEIQEENAEKEEHSEYAVKISEGYYSWDKVDEPFLQRINMRVKKGSLVAVIGQVGSGKSSLMSAMLGEMWRESGTCVVNGSVSYVPQQAWIQNKTVRDNILLFKPYNVTKYEKVIAACALNPDMQMLIGGDMTEIGERGVNLSGGQKQRISLARAVYQNNDNYLLDDPLSAVDANVGQHLFEQVLGPSGLLKNKTRILVTHRLTYLPFADHIFVMQDGQIVNEGTYEQLLNGGGPLADFLHTHTKDSVDNTITVDQSGFSSGAECEPVNSSMKRRRRRTRSKADTVVSELESSRQVVGVEDETSDIAGRLTERETEELGAVKWKVIQHLVVSASVAAALLTILFEFIFGGFVVASNIWLSSWTDSRTNGSISVTREMKDYSFGVYSGLLIGQVLSCGVASVGISIGCLFVSRNLHRDIIDRLLHAPMSFFDTTPLGRVMNRLSLDMDGVDFFVPIQIRGWFFQFIPLLATVTLLSYGSLLFLAFCVPLFVFFLAIQKLYMKTARQLKRIDSVRRSPVFVHFNETLTGATSIRAYNLADQFIADGDQFIDESQKAWYYFLMAQRLLSVTLEIMAAVVVLVTSMLTVLQRDSMSVGLAGMMVTYSLQASSFLQFYVRSSADLETQMVSVERIKEYSEVETEAPWRIESTEPENGWPSRGEVKFEEYSTRYRPGLGLVLQGVNFHVNPGEKVGVVGRTGAGKSSLLLSLFRIIEAASGSIIIDGRDISKLGLHDLRTNLTIIPQDPVIFSGSLRHNLDPFGQYIEDDLWRALEYAHLKTFVTSLPFGLQYECGENGEALSVGQRQLVCLARALLRKSKILVLDEATAAVDLETDALIQKTIQKSFHHCTILTIAHRINTILNYDRVMVMNAGSVVEFAPPDILMKDDKSLFHSMMVDAGLLSTNRNIPDSG